MLPLCSQYYFNSSAKGVYSISFWYPGCLSPLPIATHGHSRATRGGGNETGWYGSQVLYGCNSLTRNLVSSEPNSFNVHFALHILLMLTQVNANCGFHCKTISFSLSMKQGVQLLSKWQKRADSSAVNHFQVESLSSERTKVANFCPVVYLPCSLILIQTLHNY